MSIGDFSRDAEVTFSEHVERIPEPPVTLSRAIATPDRGTERLQRSDPVPLPGTFDLGSREVADGCCRHVRCCLLMTLQLARTEGDPH
jgi:hypothetical protein